MFQTVTIAPSVRLVNIKTDKYKTGEIIVSFSLPMGEDASVYAVLVKLLRRSCKAYPDMLSMNNRLAELYGASLGCGVSKRGDAQFLTISGFCIDDRFALDGEKISEEFLNLLADVIFSPNVKGGSFGMDNLDREKRLLIQEVLEEQDDKRAYAYNKCISYMCENEPFGKPRAGTPEQIEKVRMNELYPAWKTLLSTAVIQITAVGNFDTDYIVKLFTGKFEKIERKPCELNTVFLKKPQRFMRYEEKIDVNQGKLVIGYRTGMENSRDNLFAETVMVDIFGGGTYSKLFANIREKQSLAYYCSASLLSFKGLVIVQSGIDSDKEKSVSAGIINQLNDLRKGKFDDETLAASKRSLREKFTFSSSFEIASFYSSQSLEEEILTPEEFADSIDAVTREQICSAAENMVLDKIFMLAAGTEEEAKK